jgi:hypothetical protein
MSLPVKHLPRNYVPFVTSTECTKGEPRNVGFLKSLFEAFLTVVRRSRPIPAKRMGIRHAEPHAEKRVSFRGVEHGLDSFMARDFVRARTFLSQSPHSGRVSS